MKRIVLGSIILLAALTLRLLGTDWDSNAHLHPDERFLTMVALKTELPKTLSSYLDPEQSTLNPYNLNEKFFVYGMLPLTLTKLIARLVGMDSYDGITQMGRILSALFDIATLGVVFLIALIFERRRNLPPNLKYLAAAAYALSVLPIQQSHFFSVDAALTFFSSSAVFFGLVYFFEQRRGAFFGCAVSFGLAMACKLSAIFVLPLILFYLVFDRRSILSKERAVLKKIVAVFLFAAISYLALRFGDPKSFASANLFDLSLNPKFLENLRTLSRLGNAALFYPPAIQWIDRLPVVFSLVNLCCFGLGIPLAVISSYGVWRAMRLAWIEIRVLLGWGIIFFLYQSFCFVQAMRYFYLLYPLIALAAAWGILELCKIKAASNHRRYMFGFILLTLLIWPLSFIKIYMEPHPRVAASQWIIENLKEGSTLTYEYWDDALPLLKKSPEKRFKRLRLDVFKEDTEKKWAELNMKLAQADYLILSSNRAYGSIMRLPKKYPRMSKFYEELFSGRGNFEEIRTFVSYPKLFGIEFPDQWAEESFTVYDHPKVTIFRRRS